MVAAALRFTSDTEGCEEMGFVLKGSGGTYSTRLADQISVDGAGQNPLPRPGIILYAATGSYLERGAISVTDPVEYGTSRRFTLSASRGSYSWAVRRVLMIIRIVKPKAPRQIL